MTFAKTLLAGALLAVLGNAQAAVTADEAKQLGTRLTRVGAQTGATARGSGAVRNASPTSCSSDWCASSSATSFQLMTPNTKSITSPSEEKGINMPR